MVLEFDSTKSIRNEEERGLAFSRVDDFDWPNVLIVADDRKDYGERRLVIIGYLDDRLHLAVVTPRQDDLRVISLRRANRKEVGLYENEIGRGGRTP